MQIYLSFKKGSRAGISDQMTAGLAILSRVQQCFKDQSTIISKALPSSIYNSKCIFGGWAHATIFQNKISSVTHMGVYWGVKTVQQKFTCTNV
jgi:hypothetical protein